MIKTRGTLHHESTGYPHFITTEKKTKKKASLQPEQKKDTHTRYIYIYIYRPGHMQDIRFSPFYEKVADSFFFLC